MATYKAQFDAKFGINAKTSAAAAESDEYGHRQPTLTSGAWSHDEDSGVHHCTAITDTNPIGVAFRLEEMHDFISAVQHQLSYLNYLIHWEAAASPYIYNNGAYWNFAVTTAFAVDSSQGARIIRLTNGANTPWDQQIALVGSRPDFFDPIEYTGVTGVLPQPGDMIRIKGNSTLSGRVECRITKVVSEEGGSTTDITVDADVGSIMTPSTFGDATKPSVEVVRNGVTEPETWDRIDPLTVMFWGKQYTVTIDRTDAEWDEVLRIITIKHPTTSLDTGIAWALADQEPPPGHQGKSFVKGTFKFEVNIGGTFHDITAMFRVYDAARGVYVWSPRLKCTHEGTDDLKTTLDYNGAEIPIPSHVTQVRVTFVAEELESDRDQAGVFSPCLKRCNFCVRDKTNTIGTVSTKANGVGIDASSNHWYCSKRAGVPKANLDSFRPGACYQWDCPEFAIGDRPGPTEQTWADIFVSMGEWLEQFGPGNNHPTNFAHGINRTPSAAWLLNMSGYYMSFYGAYMNRWTYFSGGYGYYDGFETDGGGHEHIKFLQGADFAQTVADFSVLNYVTNRVPTAAQGVLRRAMGTTLAPHLQVWKGQLPDNTHDPSHVDRAWLLGRNPAGIIRTASRYGTGLTRGNRSVTGLEGENRVQRFNRAYKRIANGLVRDASAQPYPRSDADHFQLFAATSTIGAKANIRAVFEVRRDGPTGWGNKRIGGGGTNGRAQRVEDLGAGVYRLHCYPGLYGSHVQGVRGDTVGTFFGSGNVVALPHPYQFNASIYQSGYNLVEGGPRRKCCIGDVVSFPTKGADHRFFVKRAEAASGDDMSGITSSDWSEGKIVGTFFDFGPYMPAGGETIDIIRLEVQFISGSWQDWYGVGNYAVNQTPYDSRPLANSQDPNDLQLIWIDQDKFETVTAAGAPLTMTAIVDSGSTNDPPQVTVSAPHGLSQFDRVTIRGSDSVPNIDGSWLAIVDGLPADEFVLATAAFSGNPITTPGTTGSVYKSTETISQGEMHGYPSFNAYRWAWSTSAGMLYPNMRAEFLVDGGTQTTMTIALAAPSIKPTLTPDETTLAAWIVTVTDTRINNGDPTELGFSESVPGVSGDIFTNHLKWSWNYITKEVLLHPNLAGAYVSVQYKSTTSISIGDAPVGVWNQKTTADMSYRTKADIVDIVDEMGIIATAGAAAYEDVDFQVSTSGVMLPAVLGGRSLVLLHKAAGGTTWLGLSEGVEFHAHFARGRYYLTQAGVDLLADPFDMEAEADIANSQQETPAELLRQTVDVMDALDTLKPGFRLGFEGTGLNIYAGWMALGPDTVDYAAGGWGGNPAITKKASGAPTAWGLRDDANYSTPSVLGFAGTLKAFAYSGASTKWQHPNNALYQTTGNYAGFDTGVIIQNEGTFTGTGGVIPLEIASNTIGTFTRTGLSSYSIDFAHAAMYGGRSAINAAYLVIDFRQDPFWRRIPHDAEIVNAWTEITVSSDAIFTHQTYYFFQIASGVNSSGGQNGPRVHPWNVGFTDEDGNSWEPPAASSFSVRKEAVDITWAVIGENNEGRWVGLGSFTTTGTVEAGKKKVIDLGPAVTNILAYKDSPYRKLAIFPSGFSSGGFAPVDPNGDNLKEVLFSAMMANTRITQISTNTVASDPDEIHKKWGFTLEAKNFKASSFTISDMAVRFRLPSGVVDQRMVYGNWPTLKEIT